MRVKPDLETFADAYDSGRAQVVWTTFVADLETPVSVMLKLGAGRADSILFESVEGGAVRGRYSIIGIKPDLIWRCRGDNAEINRDALVDRDTFEACEGGAFFMLVRVWHIVGICRHGYAQPWTFVACVSYQVVPNFHERIV